ncbi:chromosome partitioning protein ParB [Jannaschia pagri]|uniref:Chromosome partitioning protein ParB n=1 Tax=Jannaschia pagri TaxID=2829797 RepID=A0ABQ4NRX0_9RHOB|nr:MULTISPECIES: ParB N-terminal domain-containing protein [unclassified Jannaschia]GIT93334.1 chromosome partitioning protein ParB [Jannaschia sp. AI_61]GIT97136.1 chromosome partitioning protein ParB [Jannaschia sp. AI_62]
MTLHHIDITDLTVSPLNVRKHGAKDCDDLVASIRALGVIQPLLVRERGDGFEVIAGQRRLHALTAILGEDALSQDERTALSAVPCLILAAGDDAHAVEASLAENIERLPMDEVDQFKAFTKLVKEGRSPEDIADTFGLTERLVAQRLALGNLHGPILTAYRKGDIYARDIRILTMASPKQQRAWWALVKDDEAYAPTGQRLKDWLFGGAHIPVENAIFDHEAAGLTVISDLFGEEAYFADAEAFWAHQNEAIAQLATCYRADDWSDVVVMDTGAYFATWDHRKTPKKNGGKVFIAVSNKGEVTKHEGYLSHAEAQRRDRAATGDAPAPKPELTKPAQTYVDLHRHAAVRADILGKGSLALRLIAAHMLSSSSLWSVEADPQRSPKEEIANSIAANTGQQTLEAERAEIATLLGLDEVETVLPGAGHYNPRPPMLDIFTRLQSLTDADILRILTFLMIESLSVDSPLIDGLGVMLGTDMREHWSPDQTFFDLVRDKQVLNAMVGEFAGTEAATANLSATAKVQRTILTACIDGTRNPADPTWVPRFMGFPKGSYRQKDVSQSETDGLQQIARNEAA